MISFTGLIFAMLFMSFFAWLFVNAYYFGVKQDMNSLLHGRRHRVIFSLCAFTGALLCYYLVAQNRFIYYWDYGGYWTHSFSQMKILFATPLLAILRLGGSIFFSDYNSILPTFVALPLKIFGYTFTRYVLVNYVLFLVPTCFIMSSVLVKQVGKRYVALIIFSAFAFTPFYLAMLNGFIDIACLIPASLALLLLKDYDALSLNREQVKRDVYISSLLLCTLLFRRYFVFYVEGYISALVMFSLYRAMKYSGSQTKLTLLKNAAMNIIIIGTFALVIMTVFFGPMLYRVLTRSYSEAYAAWDAPMKNKILGIINRYGYFTFIFAVTGLVLSFITGRLRKYNCFCAICFVVSAATFFHVQKMDMHHFYILAPELYFMSCTGMIQTIMLFRNKPVMRFSVVMLFVIILSANVMNCYFPDTRFIFSPISKFFTDVHNPLQRNDIPELNALCDYVNSKTDGNDKSVYIASNGVLNFSTMDSLRKPYAQSPVHNLLRTGETLLISGFPVGFFDASIILSAYPYDKDEVMKFFQVELSREDSLIGRHFTRDERTFKIDGGVTVYIYEKHSDFEQEDLDYIAEYFTKLFPGHEKIFADRILGREGIAETLGTKWNPKVVTVLRWLMKNGIFTPEQLAFATNRTIHEINMLNEE